MTRAPRPRAGIVSIWVLIVLTVLTGLAGTATWQYLTGRRVLRDRQQALQATWLTRSGIEIAAAHLLADPAYRGETLTPVPNGTVEVKIERGEGDTFRVTATGQALGSRQPHVRTSSRTFRRVLEGGKAKLEVVVPADGLAP